MSPMGTLVLGTNSKGPSPSESHSQAHKVSSCSNLLRDTGALNSHNNNNNNNGDHPLLKLMSASLLNESSLTLNLHHGLALTLGKSPKTTPKMTLSAAATTPPDSTSTDNENSSQRYRDIRTKKRKIAPRSSDSFSDREQSDRGGSISPPPSSLKSLESQNSRGTLETAAHGGLNHPDKHNGEDSEGDGDEDEVLSIGREDDEDREGMQTIIDCDSSTIVADVTVTGCEKMSKKRRLSEVDAGAESDEETTRLSDHSRPNSGTGSPCSNSNSDRSSSSSSSGTGTSLSPSGGGTGHLHLLTSPLPASIFSSSGPLSLPYNAEYHHLQLQQQLGILRHNYSVTHPPHLLHQVTPPGMAAIGKPTLPQAQVQAQQPFQLPFSISDAIMMSSQNQNQNHNRHQNQHRQLLHPHPQPHPHPNSHQQSDLQRQQEKVRRQRQESFQQQQASLLFSIANILRPDFGLGGNPNAAPAPPTKSSKGPPSTKNHGHGHSHSHGQGTTATNASAKRPTNVKPNFSPLNPIDLSRPTLLPSLSLVNSHRGNKINGSSVAPAPAPAIKLASHKSSGQTGPANPGNFGSRSNGSGSNKTLEKKGSHKSPVGLPAIKPPKGSSNSTTSSSGSGGSGSSSKDPAPAPPLPDKATDSNPWPAWVYCTRYSDRPSSGPRTRRARTTKKEKEIDEKRPRTAFTSEQLARLKREFDENRYLTEKRRVDLARELRLHENQIKIWFQNKRAKLKKSSGQRGGLALQLMAQGLYNHSTIRGGGGDGEDGDSDGDGDGDGGDYDSD